MDPRDRPEQPPGISATAADDAAVGVHVPGQPGPVDRRRSALHHETLYRISESLRHARDAEGLLSALCSALVAEGGYLGAVIDTFSEDGRLLRSVGAGEVSSCRELATLLSQDPLHRPPAVVAMSTGRIAMCVDILTNPALAPWREQAALHGISGLASIPLRRGERTQAVLTLLSGHPGLREAEGGLLLLAQNVAYALERLDFADRLRQAVEERRLLQVRLFALHEAECARIAATVRGEPVQLLAAMDLRLGLLRRRVRKGAPQVSSALEQVHGMVDGVIEGLRELLDGLEPPAPQLSLEDLVREAAAQIFADRDVQVRFDVTLTGADRRLGCEVRVQALRVLREALIEARDSGARVVDVVFDPQQEGLQVTVSDDGPLVSPPEVETSRHRAAAVGGVCRTDRSMGGTAVRLWLPYVVPGSQAEHVRVAAPGRTPLRLVDLG